MKRNFLAVPVLEEPVIHKMIQDEFDMGRVVPETREKRELRWAIHNVLTQLEWESWLKHYTYFYLDLPE